MRKTQNACSSIVLKVRQQIDQIESIANRLKIKISTHTHTHTHTYTQKIYVIRNVFQAIKAKRRQDIKNKLLYLLHVQVEHEYECESESEHEYKHKYEYSCHSYSHTHTHIYGAHINALYV